MSVYADFGPGRHDLPHNLVAHDPIDLHDWLGGPGVQDDVLAKEIDLDRDDLDLVFLQGLSHLAHDVGRRLFKHSQDSLLALIGRTVFRQARAVRVADVAVNPVGHFVALE